MPSPSSSAVSRRSDNGCLGSSPANKTRSRACTAGFDCVAAAEAAPPNSVRAAVIPFGPSIRRPFNTRLTVLR